MDIDRRTAEEEMTEEACSVVGAEISEPNTFRAISVSKEAVEAADDPLPVTVKRTMTSTGARITAQIGGGSEGGKSVSGSVSSIMSFKDFSIEEEEECLRSGAKKDEAVIDKVCEGSAEGGSVPGLKIEVGENAVVADSGSRMSFEEFLKATNTKVMTTEEYLRLEAKEEPVIKQSEEDHSMAVRVKDEPGVCFENDKDASMEDKGLNDQVKFENEGVDAKEEEPMDVEPISCSNPVVPVKEEPIEAIPISCSRAIIPVKEEPIDAIPINCLKAVVPVKEESDLVVVVKENLPSKKTNETFLKKFNRIPAKKGGLGSQNPSSDAKKQRTEDPNQKACSIPVEDGEFPDDPDWFLVGRTMVSAISTTKGRKLADNEIVHFSSPIDWRSNTHWIVRFSTKRYGEIGRLPMDWGKCIVPLANSGKVKLYGRCVAAPPCLSIMQEILLYVSFYIHRSIFMEDDNSSWGWKLEAVNIDSTIYPLLTLFKWLKIKPYQKAEFTPEELDSRKRLLNLEAEPDEAGSMLPIVKRRKGCQQYPEQGKDEQAVSESSLCKLVGAADASNLQEMEPPSSLTCDLRSYQKQALHWMSELEKGIDVEKAARTLHPCWAAYRIADERASSIYVNLFSGEATTKFPTAMQMARGGILADAMGLGKTVMTIALILKNRGRGTSDNQGHVKNVSDGTDIRTDSHMDTSSKPKCGTLIVCPMALLGQWKDELETHSEPESISVLVHYGGARTYSPNVFEKHDVVLTTYGVLTQAHKNEGEGSIFHKVDWYRVVLDEAHTIKSWKTQGARASFTLSSHCRWCLTGTPIQNNLEDLYSLLCFLHVEPWCNWAWWNKLIQKPYENGDPRGLRLIKAILRPLMLRRTKESKDKEGRAILVLPPTDIQVIECEQSEAEQDFYDALFKRSKVQFDQFVAQGKVLHNYASILELLLRLRQCCNHPFLVMSRCDSQKFADLNKLAKRFLEADPDSDHSARNLPTKAYVEEVVDGIRRGENSECPICLESADDPVLTPCAHRMCRECLLSSWRSPTAGICPICRQVLRKTDLITCPSESRFQVDIEKNWKESSKVSSLLQCLERIRRSSSDEKSIVFSQWTTFLDLLEIPLKKKGIGYLRYDGRLSQSQREKVLYEFNQTNHKMVLLMSLRAGGVGLNLTAASNVFLMDPWWNPAVEEQAIMRIHRIGQKRTVSVRRFIVKDTVEERMQQVQARKQRMIEGALTDEEVRSARIEELKMLFR